MAIGALPDISFMIDRAFYSASAKFYVTWLTKPIFCAYSPLTLRPVKISSFAKETPIVLAKVCVPPPPGMRLQ